MARPSKARGASRATRAHRCCSEQTGWPDIVRQAVCLRIRRWAQPCGGLISSGRAGRPGIATKKRGAISILGQTASSEILRRAVGQAGDSCRHCVCSPAGDSCRHAAMPSQPRYRHARLEHAAFGFRTCFSAGDSPGTRRSLGHSGRFGGMASLSARH